MTWQDDAYVFAGGELYHRCTELLWLFVCLLFRCCLTYKATFQGKDFWQKELHAVEICLCHLVRKFPSLNNNENEGKEQILYQIYQNETPSCVCGWGRDRLFIFKGIFFPEWRFCHYLLASFQTHKTFFVAWSYFEESLNSYFI